MRWWPFGKRERSAPRDSGRAGRSHFTGAKVTPALQDWITSDISVDSALLNDLIMLRSRSAEAFRNNSWAKSFRRLVTNNVIGPAGIRLDNMALGPDGKLDQTRNGMVKAAWQAWQRPAFCSVSRDTAYHTLATSALASIAQDGWVMVRLVRGFDNPFGFALELLPAPFLDHEMEEVRPNGNKVRAGIERNAWGEPVAFYLFEDNPTDYRTLTRFGPRQRVPAEQILFLYLKETADQDLGVPWLAPVLVHLQHLDGYQEAAVVDARASACSMGIWEEATPGMVTGPGMEEGEEDDDPVWSGQTEDIEPGSIKIAPPGMKWTSHDPNNPNNTIDAFTATVLRGVAAGLGCSYINLATDFTRVNFSSAKMSNSREQDFWRGLQSWWIEHFEREVFRAWYDMAVLTGALAIPPAFAERAYRPVFRPRGWESPDPAKESTAHERNIKNGLDSRTRITASRGFEFEEILADLAAEEAKATAAGVSIGAEETAEAVDVGEEIEEALVNAS